MPSAVRFWCTNAVNEGKMEEPRLDNREPFVGEPLCHACVRSVGPAAREALTSGACRLRRFAGSGCWHHLWWEELQPGGRGLKQQHLWWEELQPGGRGLKWPGSGFGWTAGKGDGDGHLRWKSVSYARLPPWAGPLWSLLDAWTCLNAPAAWGRSPCSLFSSI